MSDADQHIAALLSEERVFEPAEAFAARAVVQDRSVYERAEADHEAFWAEQADRLELGQALGHGHDLGPPWVKWFEGGQLNASYNCLDRHVEAGGGGQGRVLLGGRARRAAGDHLPGTPRRRLPVRERPQGPRRAQGRPSRDLPGHDPRAPGRDARVRSDRGAALGRLRWLLIGGPPRPHQRRRGQGLDHRRRWLSPRRRRAAEGQRGRGGPRVSDDRARRHGPADRRRARVHRGAGPLVPRPGRRTVDRVRARTLGRASTRSTCSTRAGPPGSPRASCTRPAATSRRWPRRIG